MLPKARPNVEAIVDQPADSLAFAKSPLHTANAKTSRSVKGSHRRRRASTNLQCDVEDDTPRAFSRLMAQTYRPHRSGEDNGDRAKKKSKKSIATHDSTIDKSVKVSPGRSIAARDTHIPPANDLKIQPHEPLNHFAARVDAALPFSTLKQSKSTTSALHELKAVGLKTLQTKTERKMQKMQEAWRQEDLRLREKSRRQRDQEERDNSVDEEDVEEMGVDTEGHDESAPTAKRRKKAIRRADLAEPADIWGHLKDERITAGRASRTGLVGLHNVVQAPPRLRQPVRQPPKVVGGLKHQSDLSEARLKVIEGYREMMRQNRSSIPLIK